MSTQLFKVATSSPKPDRSPNKILQVLTVQEVADLVRCKKRTIYDMVEQSRIPFRRVGGRLLFDLDEIIDWTRKG
jgi:excisionase family DNA binding protein